MMRFSPILLIAFFLAWTAPLGAEQIRFARTPDVSPDGKLVAFSYLGDIWVVDAKGGVARHVTMHEKHELYPVFSPDGKYLAFSSNRHGSYDVFVVPIQGGRPTRLTHDSAEDFVTGWTPDSQRVVFSSSRTTDYPFRFQLFTVAVTGGRAERVGIHEGREGAYSPAGDLIAYVRGPGTWYRKGYRGSSNDDIWVCQADGNHSRQLTHFNGQDNSPMWSADGKAMFYVSECFGGRANIVRQDWITAPEAGGGKMDVKPVSITFHQDDGVRRARISANGQWIVYECGPDLWIVPTQPQTAKAGKQGKTQPRKLNIEVNADDRGYPVRTVTFTSSASEFSLSHDEKHIAFVVHGEIFLMPRSGGKAKRLTDHPAFDHGVAWSPDSKKILFLSDRSGHEDIYLLEPDDPDHPELVQAHRFKVKQLTKTPEAEIGLTFSPDGKVVSFLRKGKLVTMEPDGTKEKIIIDDGQIFDYEWSPDSRWICYARQDNTFASELWIAPATGPTKADPARNITRFATYNAGVTWSKTGNKLAFVSQRRRNMYSMFVLSLQKPAAPGAPASKDIDWEDIHLRVRQPSQMGVNEGAISNDGSKVAFRATQDGDDLWVANSDGGQLTRLTTGNTRPSQIQWSRLLSTILYFRDGNGNIRMISTGSTTTAAPIPFQAKMTIRQEEEFLEIFDQGWRVLNETFYDPNFHGANWNKVREKYRPLVKHCSLKEDLYALISLMLGELNASHLGISGFLGSADQPTADLGLLFDEGYKGPGLRIAEIVKRGPADRRGLNLNPGDVILSIDGIELTDQTDLAQTLNDKVNETITLKVTTNPANPKNRRTIEIQGASRPAIANLMYERWVDRNARRVADLSKGKLGYIHIPGMDEPGLERFLRALYSDNFDKDAIVLDVRFNSGGYTHEQVLNYLGGKDHTFFHHRDGGMGPVLNFSDRRWTKPLVLLINNRSYSDAEIFPHAFRTLGLGKLVGQTTGGMVIGTRNITLIDGSLFRTPRIGVSTFKGVNMEKEGVSPDILVDIHPDQMAKGEDPQLEKAVQILEQEVAAWRKNREAVGALPLGNPQGKGPEANPNPAPKKE